MDLPKNQIIIIFGASGDLAKRKLLPSLFFLFKNGRMPERFAIVGVGRTEYDDDSFSDYLRSQSSFFKLKNEQEMFIMDSFLKRVHYVSMETSQSEEYHRLKERLEEIDELLGNTDNYLFYLATPPSLYAVIPQSLRFAQLNRKKQSHGERRIIVEKPFGYDLRSAQNLNTILKSCFFEHQILRIDHFLGKETVMNIMALRFSNGIFEPLWNRNYIDHIEITAVENLGIENRGAFYDRVGALRDMVQNHLVHLLAITTIEPPIYFNADNFRNEIVKLYQSLRPLSKEEIASDIIRGQYVASVTLDGEKKGYLEEKNIPPTSRTETFVAMRLFIDNWRWEGVPIYIRTGKQMPTKVTEIIVHFRSSPHVMFRQSRQKKIFNKLIIRIYPNESVVMNIGMKIPGVGYDVQDVTMNFEFDPTLGQRVGDAYVRLLEDAMNGDASLFSRSDEVEASWSFFDPILKEWNENPEIPIYNYAVGSWGPVEADRLNREMSTWTNPCSETVKCMTILEEQNDANSSISKGE